MFDGGFLTSFGVPEILEYAMRVGPATKNFKGTLTSPKKRIRRTNACPSKLPGIYPCPQCPKVYSYKNNLLRHMNIECGKQPNLNCPYCNYKSKHKCDMARHIKKRHISLLDQTDIEKICKVSLDNTESVVASCD